MMPPSTNVPQPAPTGSPARQSYARLLALLGSVRPSAPALTAAAVLSIAGALASISDRLKAKLRKQEPAESLEDELDQDYEALDETAEEWSDDDPVELLTEDDRRTLEQEITDLDAFAELAASGAIEREVLAPELSSAAARRLGIDRRFVHLWRLGPVLVVMVDAMSARFAQTV